MSTTNPVNGSSATANEATQTETKKKNELGQDAFLQLLTTQLAHQDPLNPMDNSEYIAQLATFSQLEQLTNINSSMTSLVQLNSALLLAVTGGNNGNTDGTNTDGTKTDGSTTDGTTNGGN